MKPGIVTLVGLLVVAQSSDPQALADPVPPAPECSSYSLEGISLDQPVASAMAVIPGAEWLPGYVSPADRSRFVTRSVRHGRPIDISLTIAGGVVDEISIDYLPFTLRKGLFVCMGGKWDREADAYGAALESTLSGRLGAPTWTGQLERMEGIVPGVAWINEPCDRVVILRSGRVNKAPTQFLVVGMARASTWQAALDERATFASPAADAPADGTHALAPRESLTSPDCTTRTLVGFYLGMPLGDAKVLAQGARWARGAPSRDGRQVYYAFFRKTGSLPRAQLHLWFSEGLLVEMSVFFPSRTREEAASQLAALERGITAGFGEPTIRSIHAMPNGLFRDIWTSVSCDAVVSMEHGQMDTRYEPHLHLSATLEHASH